VSVRQYCQVQAEPDVRYLKINFQCCEPLRIIIEMSIFYYGYRLII